ncbi:MAG: tetratricopeptide repeat protein [Shimia sp.]
MIRIATLFAACTLPVAAIAAGGGTSTPPTTTATTATCEEGYIYDEEAKACVVIQESRLDQDGLYDQVRELAYAGRLDDARAVLGMMDAADDRVQTYLGFTARKSGDATAATRYYRAALRANPDNLLARSYMGQGLAEAGDMAGARAQLREIRARGGRETWAEKSLVWAIETGRGTSY